MLRFRAVAAGIVVAAVAVLASVVPASAHDQLLTSSPAAGERLASSPDEIALTFSADVLDMGAEVLVVDGAGADWAGSAPVVHDGTVTVALTDALPAAGYEVRWRVVSSDGHPISGVIPFTVGDAAPLERASAAPTAQAPASASTDAGLPRVVVVGAIGAGIALVVFAVSVFFFRRRAGRDAQS